MKGNDSSSMELFYIKHNKLYVVQFLCDSETYNFMKSIANDIDSSDQIYRSYTKELFLDYDENKIGNSPSTADAENSTYLETTTRLSSYSSSEISRSKYDYRYQSYIQYSMDDMYPNDLSMMDDATPYEYHSWASESRNQDGIPGYSENFYTHIIKVGVWYIYQEYYYIYYYEWEDVETVSSNDFTDNKITVEILFSDAYLYYPASHWSSPPNPSFEFTSSKGYLEHVRKIHNNYLFITDFELVYTCDSTISNFSVMHFDKNPNYTPNLVSFLGNKIQHKITSSILGPIQTVLDLGYELIDLYSTKENSTYEDPNQTDKFGDWSVGQSVSSIVIYDTNETIYGDYIDIVQQGSSVNPNRGERVVFTINPHDSNDINYEEFKVFYEFYFYIDIDSSDSDEIRFNRSHYFNDTNAKTHSVTLGTC